MYINILDIRVLTILLLLIISNYISYSIGLKEGYQQAKNRFKGGKNNVLY